MSFNRILIFSFVMGGRCCWWGSCLGGCVGYGDCPIEDLSCGSCVEGCVGSCVGFCVGFCVEGCVGYGDCPIEDLSCGSCVGSCVEGCVGGCVGSCVEGCVGSWVGGGCCIFGSPFGFI